MASCFQPFGNFTPLTTTDGNWCPFTPMRSWTVSDLRLTHWLTVWLAYWLTFWLTYWLTDWLTYCLPSCLTFWLSCWLNYWLTDLLNYWLIYWRIDWFIDLMTYWLTDWLIDLLIDLLTDLLTLTLLLKMPHYCTRTQKIASNSWCHIGLQFVCNWSKRYSTNTKCLRLTSRAYAFLD